jgi:dipeptidyl-peptidase-4
VDDRRRQTESYPRQRARTRGFTLGRPRSFTVASDGARVVFLRSAAGDDPVTGLWVFDVEQRRERLVADPSAMPDAAGAEATPEERARRERTREMAQGIVAYATDPGARVASFVLGGRVWLADVESGGLVTLPTAASPFDPRPDPTGRRVAYVADRVLRIVDREGNEGPVIGEDDPNVSWGLAEFVAAEEMHRYRGFWWSPDGQALAVARVDTSLVPRWHIANPTEPEAKPLEVPYPAAGTRNADVSVAILDLGGGRTDVTWDRAMFPYLVHVGWSRPDGPTLLVQSRDQRMWRVLRADAATGRTEVVLEDRDDVWLEIVPGAPAWLDDGRLVFVEQSEDAHRLTIDARPVTPPGLQVSAVVDAIGEAVVFKASETDRPSEVHLWSVRAGQDDLRRLTDGVGVHDGAAGGDVLVLVSASLEEGPVRTDVLFGGTRIGTLQSFAEEPAITVGVSFATVGERAIRTALLLPRDAGAVRLPVLLDPYGGPHFRKVTMARDAFLESQWFADQGFAVIVADGRGTPGQGLSWEQSVHGDLATPALQDQVDALRGMAETHPELDLERVGIRGWSFGGYLAALAVLRRPDVFHAAVAGAPVTDMGLYDTHYTERYLGADPAGEPYTRSSLLEDAKDLERPLLIIHGLVDDNVVVAHSLRLSRALLEAGRPHAVLPLSGVTHMTPQEEVAENLLLLQVAFLKEALGLR